MKIRHDNVRILSFFLVMLSCCLPSFALESPLLPQSTERQVTDTLLMQLGSQEYNTRFDCSHLVHALYERSGMDYPYTTSHTLYRGIEEFRGVVQPKFGDLVVWRGHMGIVVDPSRHLFISALKKRVKISSYISEYWKHRGTPRFFRYAFSVGKQKDSDRTGNLGSTSILSVSSGDN
jgi:hypothetical protein